MNNQKYHSEIKKSILKIIEDSQIVYSDFKFNIKSDMEKLREKIESNIKDAQKKSPKNIMTSLYSINNLISCTFEFDTVEQTKKLFDILTKTNLEKFKI